MKSLAQSTTGTPTDSDSMPAPPAQRRAAPALSVQVLGTPTAPLPGDYALCWQAPGGEASDEVRGVWGTQSTFLAETRDGGRRADSRRAVMLAVV